MASDTMVEMCDLGYKPQKANVYNQTLPYSDKLDMESECLLNDIKTNLAKSILAREMRPGCALWTSRFNKYLKLYGLKFSKDDHIGFIKLFYELLVTDNLEPTRVTRCVATLTQLLKKRYLISREELQLEWRPLYNLCVRVIEKNRAIGILRCTSSMETSLKCLMRLARIYFPASATQEILDEFRPKLCALSMKNIQYGLEYLEVFLPICVPPEEATITYKLWFEEFMTLWEVCHTPALWEDSMMWLMARLSNFCMGYIDWEPYTALMFTRFVRSLNLPVYYRQKHAGKLYKLDVASIAIWITSTLDGDRNSTFFHLEKLMQTLETYYHPANLGRWSGPLKEFLHKLSYYFVQRLYSEKHRKYTWETQIPNEYKMCDEDIDRFVQCLKPCLEQAMFSRQGSQEIQWALQLLSSVRPNLIIPLTLEKLYAAMDSLTEPHRLTSSMMTVSSVSRYMVHGATSNYPEGATHVFPLLTALLPGIDPNDIRKCVVTFNFLIHFINMCPLIDSSEAANHYTDLTEEEHIVCETTANLQDFVLQFFDKLCLWVESSSLDFIRLEQHGNLINSSKNRLEVLAESAISSVTVAVLNQCSPEIFSVILRKVYNFTIGKVFEIQVSGKMVAILCQSFAKINAKETYKLFMPYLITNIRRLLDETANLEKEEHLDAELLYNMQILSELVDGRSELLSYADDIITILDRTVNMTSLSGGQLAARMLDLMVGSLTYIVPKDYKSTAVPYSTHVKDYLPIREWGRGELIEELRIDWFMPGPNEIALVEKLLKKYLVPALEKLTRYGDGKLTMGRESMRRTLRIIIASLSAHPVLPMWDEPPVQLVESVLEPWLFNLTVGGGETVKMPDGRNIRKAIADVIHKVQERILKVDEGDTKSIIHMIQIYNAVMFNKTRAHDFDHHWKNFNTLKKLMEDRLHQNKRHLRHILINRAMLQHEMRLESRTCAFTATHQQILNDLFTLSVSRYSQNRLYSQSKLFSIITYFPYSYTVLTSRILDILRMDSGQNHEKFKGCLYVLLGPKSSPIVIRHDWQFIRQIWHQIVLSMPSEKPSIIGLISSICDVVYRYFPTIAIYYKFSERSLVAAKRLLPSPPSEDDTSGDIDNNEVTQCQLRADNYGQLIDALLDACLSGNLHWRYHEMAVSFLKVLVHGDIKYSARAIHYFLNGLIDDSIKIRKLSLRAIVYCLFQLKPKFVKVPLELDRSQMTLTELTPGLRPDNKWLMYNSTTCPTTDEQWETIRFLHDGCTGFYTWPTVVETYAAPSKQPYIDQRPLSRDEDTFLAFFQDVTKVELLIKYMSMEQKKGEDEFNMYKHLMFKNLFKIFEDRLLDVFVPHLKRLVTDRLEASQLCAAEMLSGLIKGMKHWRYVKIDATSKQILPLLDSAILHMCSETQTDWGVCLVLALDARDPQRYHWLLEFLTDTLNISHESTSYITCTRLHLIYSAVHQQNWRNAELHERLLNALKPHLSHPYQNVRERIICALAMVFTLDLHYPNCGGPNFQLFYTNEMKPLMRKLYAHTVNKKKSLLTTVTATDVTDGIQQLSLQLTGDGEEEDALRLLKLSGKLVITLMKTCHMTLPEYFDLLPLICVYQSYDVDDEIEPICSSFLTMLAQTVTRVEHMPIALEHIRMVAECPIWAARSVCAEFLSCFVFHNFAVLVSRPHWVLEIESIGLKLLEDTQPEVRLASGQLFNGLLHCQFLLHPDQLLEIFKTKAKTKLRKKTRTPANNNGQTENLIRIRHAGVLGLCAFINAHPYDVPDFLPHIFGQLGIHLNDPQPIPATIRRTVGDFKRTHHENWQMHKLKFTEEELLVLSDLTVPPSYYA